MPTFSYSIETLYVVVSQETVACMCVDGEEHGKSCLNSCLQDCHLCTGALDHLQNHSCCALLFHRRRKLFPLRLTDHEQIHFLYISLHVRIRMVTICVCYRWHFRGIWSHFAFEAVAVYSPPPVLMLWIPSLDMLALCVCVYYTVCKCSFCSV